MVHFMVVNTNLATSACFNSPSAIMNWNLHLKKMVKVIAELDDDSVPNLSPLAGVEF